jgi:hypothetical protein
MALLIKFNQVRDRAGLLVSLFIVLFQISAFGVEVCSPEGFTQLKNQIQKCHSVFARLKCVSDPETLIEKDLSRVTQKSAPAIPAEAVESLRRERDRLRSQLVQDYKHIESPIESSGTFRQEKALSPGSVQISNKMVEMLASGLKKNGYDIEIRRQKKFDHLHKDVVYEVPERDVLVIRQGSAQGALAREIERIEKYVASRKASSKINSRSEDEPQEIFVDPLFTLARNSLGYFSSSKSLGTGIHLAPNTLFNSQEVAVEILRHELRHLKVHFDNFSADSSPYRFFVYTKKEPFKELGSYEGGFAFDEVEGFLSNLKSLQSKMGNETEAYRKQIDKVEMSSEEKVQAFRSFRKSLEKVQKEAKERAETIDRFIKQSIGTASEARRILADPMMTTAKLEQMMDIKEYSTVPGQTSVDIFINGDRSNPNHVLNVRVPKFIAIQGLEAIRDFTVSSLTSTETLLLRRSLELRARRDDIYRTATDRLPSYFRPKPESIRD